MAQPQPTPVTNLLRERHRAKVTQLELAAKAGMSLGVIARIEHATDHQAIGLIGVDKFIRLAEALGLCADELYPRLGRMTCTPGWGLQP